MTNETRIVNSLRCGLGGGANCSFSWTTHIGADVCIAVLFMVVVAIVTSPLSRSLHRKAAQSLPLRYLWSPPFSGSQTSAIHTWSHGAPARAWAFPVDGISLTGLTLALLAIGVSSWDLAHTSIYNHHDLEILAPVAIGVGSLIWLVRRILVARQGYPTGLPHVLITLAGATSWMLAAGLTKHLAEAGTRGFSFSWTGVSGFCYPIASGLAWWGSAVIHARTSEIEARAVDELNSHDEASIFRYARTNERGYLERSIHNPHPSQYAGLVHPEGIDALRVPIRVGTNLLVVGPSVEEMTQRALEPGVVTRLGPTVLMGNSKNLGGELFEIIQAQGSTIYSWSSSGQSMHFASKGNLIEVRWTPFEQPQNSSSCISLALDLITSSVFQLTQGGSPGNLDLLASIHQDHLSFAEYLAGLLLYSQYTSMSPARLFDANGVVTISVNDLVNELKSSGDRGSAHLGSKIASAQSDIALFAQIGADEIGLIIFKVLSGLTGPEDREKRVLRIGEFLGESAPVLYIDTSSASTASRVITSVFLRRLISSHASNPIRLAPVHLALEDYQHNVSFVDLHSILVKLNHWQISCVGTALDNPAHPLITQESRHRFSSSPKLESLEHEGEVSRDPTSEDLLDDDPIYRPSAEMGHENFWTAPFRHPIDHERAWPSVLFFDSTALGDAPKLGRLLGSGVGHYVDVDLPSLNQEPWKSVARASREILGRPVK